MAHCCVYSINDFPDEVLSNVIAFLPTKEAVRTSVLSRRWRYLFSLISDLALKMEINNEDGEKCFQESDLFMDFVDRLVRRDTPIQRLRLLCNPCVDPERVGTWIGCLPKHNINELNIWSNQDILEGSLLLPPSLFSCRSLVVLKLNLRCHSYELKLPDTVCLPHLKVVDLEQIAFPNDGSEERLFSNCPVLENLVLDDCIISGDCVKFRVSNPNIKQLTLKLQVFNLQEESHVDILIDAPSLVLLDYRISRFQSLVLLNSKSLTAAMIEKWFCDKYVTTALGDFRQIQYIHTLDIQYSLLQDLKVFEVPIPSFEKLTCLKIWNWRYLFDPSCVGYFLARCVVLETLIFTGSTLCSDVKSIETGYSLQKAHELGPLLLHLKTIEIHLGNLQRVETLMKVIVLFLKNGDVLEELNIHCPDSDQEVVIMKKIFSFPKVSEKCRVQCKIENTYKIF